MGQAGWDLLRLRTLSDFAPHHPGAVLRDHEVVKSRQFSDGAHIGVEVLPSPDTSGPTALLLTVRRRNSRAQNFGVAQQLYFNAAAVGPEAPWSHNLRKWICSMFEIPEPDVLAATYSPVSRKWEVVLWPLMLSENGKWIPQVLSRVRQLQPHRPHRPHSVSLSFRLSDGGRPVLYEMFLWHAVGAGA